MGVIFWLMHPNCLRAYRGQPLEAFMLLDLREADELGVKTNQFAEPGLT